MAINIPIMKRAGMITKFSEPTFAREGSRVRIRTTSWIAGLTRPQPVSWLVGPNEAGQWVIYELREHTTPREIEIMMRRAQRPAPPASEPADQD